MRDFRPLPLTELGPGAGFRRPMQLQSAQVTLESPAHDVMTDLLRTSPATIRPQAPISGANHFMIARGVRLLLVVDDHEAVLGVVTATDVLGERPMRVASERAQKRDDLTVADIMTPAADVEVIDLHALDGARVGHVLETLRQAGRQHALVVDQDVIPAASILDKPVTRAMVRGVFSISQIARQLGIAVQSTEVARTFAQIEAAIAR
jgi:CBS domain-containing protein